ncbi:MAG: glycosyltransferase family 1 protein [Bacteroidaceae bacterium]|nr:glycosyltransferase family 1 protein [Bacteroidaceae bacterium]
MKILFLIYHGFSDISGISKKIAAQVEGLKQCNHEVHVCTYSIKEDGHRCRFIDDEILQDFGKNCLAPFKKRICYDKVYEYCILNGIQAVYSRSFHNANPFTIKLFKKLKNAGIPCVMEIPTYPYDQEYLGADFRTRLGTLIDKLFRHQLAMQMKGIVTFADVETIFGQKTIRISNGIDFDAIPMRSPIPNPANEVHCLGVAEVHYWHAFDRLIHGLGEYYKQAREIKVYFHIVGGIAPSDLNEWKEYVKENHIEPYVIFHGAQFGEALTESFNRADFGIGSLGRHRSGIDKIKTLKNREYAARGLKFIYSETDDDFETMPYILKAPADESPIDVESIIRFNEECRISPEEIRKSITHLSWKEQMRIVMENIKGNK